MSEKPTTPSDPARISRQLLGKIRQMIEEARTAMAVTVNGRLTMLYWRIGSRVNQEILKGERADYGKRIIATLLQELAQEYGGGFSYTALTRMIKFTECFPDTDSVATLS